MKFETFLEDVPTQAAPGKGAKLDGKTLKREHSSMYWYLWDGWLFDIRPMRVKLGLPEVDRNLDTYGEGETPAEQAKLSDARLAKVAKAIESKLKGRKFLSLLLS